MKKKTTGKPKVQSCPCPCAPPPRKRRRVPTYTPRQPPQFYAALPMPQTQFHTETVRRAVQEEFARYHSPRKTITVTGAETQTDLIPLAGFDDGVSSTTSGDRRWDEQELDEEIDMEERLERLQERLEAAKSQPFMPTPFMPQPDEEPRMIRGRYGMGDVRREEMREFLISQVEARNPSPTP